MRWLLGLPVPLYRHRLDRLLGHRFLLLTHRGRHTGRRRQSLLEVVRYDPIREESTVVAGWGRQTQWYRNLQAHPALAVQTAGRRYAPIQRFLSSEEGHAVLAAWWRGRACAPGCATWSSSP